MKEEENEWLQHSCRCDMREKKKKKVLKSAVSDSAFVAVYVCSKSICICGIWTRFLIKQGVQA